MFLYSYSSDPTSIVWRLLKIVGFSTYTYEEMFKDYEKGKIYGKINITDVYSIDEIYEINPHIKKLLSENSSKSIAYADILRRSVEKDLTSDNRIFYIRFVKNFHDSKMKLGIYLYENRSEKKLIRITTKKIICFPKISFSLFPFNGFFKSISGMIISLIKKNQNAHKSSNKNPEKSKRTVEINEQVLVCPHKTLNFGGMFSKDYILPNRTNVKLYRYFEFEKNQEILDYYADKGLEVIFYSDSFFTYLKNNFISIVWQAIQSLSRLAIKIFHIDIRDIYLLLLFDLKVAYSENLLRKLKPKIIIVGYDILFPRHFALAAERLGIVTLGMTERVFILNVTNLPVMLDTYFVPTEEVAAIVKKNPYSHVKKFVNIGLIRGDIV